MTSDIPVRQGERGPQRRTGPARLGPQDAGRSDAPVGVAKWGEDRVHEAPTGAVPCGLLPESADGDAGQRCAALLDPTHAGEQQLHCREPIEQARFPDAGVVEEEAAAGERGGRTPRTSDRPVLRVPHHGKTPTRLRPQVESARGVPHTRPHTAATPTTTAPRRPPPHTPSPSQRSAPMQVPQQHGNRGHPRPEPADREPQGVVCERDPAAVGKIPRPCQHLDPAALKRPLLLRACRRGRQSTTASWYPAAGDRDSGCPPP